MSPDKCTNQEFFIDVGDGHQLYVHDWGNPEAKSPIIFLHGGPGSGCSDSYKTSFDPITQRVIFFDQRGSGRSLPKGSLEHNTTPDLVEDIEKITKQLKLRSFVLAGGSWGSCLALAYALKYPRRVEALVLRGIFTGSKVENDWLYQGGFRAFFPDVWQALLDQTPVSYRSNPASYHIARVLSDDSEVAVEAAYTLANLQISLMKLDDRFTASDLDSFDPTPTKIEAYYSTKNFFMPDNYILDNAHKLTQPVWLIQGRYDMVCPPLTAWELDRRLPNSKLLWTVAGHANDRANYDTYKAVLLQFAG